jgi:flavodoxin
MGLFSGSKENYKDKKSIVIYFSRADENYFGGSMRYVDKGNTEVIAEFIKDIVNADMFKVEPLEPYSADYMQCIEEAKERTRKHNAPIKEAVPDISSYEVISFVFILIHFLW